MVSMTLELRHKVRQRRQSRLTYLCLDLHDDCLTAPLYSKTVRKRRCDETDRPWHMLTNTAKPKVGRCLAREPAPEFFSLKEPLCGVGIPPPGGVLMLSAHRRTKPLEDFGSFLCCGKVRCKSQNLSCIRTYPALACQGAVADFLARTSGL